MWYVSKGVMRAVSVRRCTWTHLRYTDRGSIRLMQTGTESARVRLCCAWIEKTYEDGDGGARYAQLGRVDDFECHDCSGDDIYDPIEHA